MNVQVQPGKIRQWADADGIKSAEGRKQQSCFLWFSSVQGDYIVPGIDFFSIKPH